MIDRTIHLAAAIGLMAALTLVSGADALDVRSDSDEGVDFAAYGSYKWIAGAEAGIPRMQEFIENAVRAQLESKGLSEDEDAPGLWVVTHAAVEGLLQVDAQDYGYDYRWRSWGRTSVNFRDIEVGTLVVDLIDAEAGELVWRGIAEDAFNPEAKRQDKNEKKILKAAELLFERFPPQP